MAEEGGMSERARRANAGATDMEDDASDPESRDQFWDSALGNWLLDLEEKFYVASGRLLNTTLFSSLMGLLTVYALFGDDLKLACMPRSTDETFWGLSSVALGTFTLEFALQCYVKVRRALRQILGVVGIVSASPRAVLRSSPLPLPSPIPYSVSPSVLVSPSKSFVTVKPEYRGNFYFWLDLVSTVSLITDIGWLMEGLGLSGADSTSALKAGRASRGGAKAGRVVRIVRLVRMVRIVKLFKLKTAQDAKKDQEQAEQVRRALVRDPDDRGSAAVRRAGERRGVREERSCVREVVA